MGQLPFSGSQPHRYSTIPNLRAAGISETSVSDAEALRLIELSSNVIDRVTDQFFVPAHQILELDGEDDKIIHHPKLLPILKIFQLALINVETTEPFIFSTDEFSLSPNRRYVRREPLLGFTGRKRIVLDPLIGPVAFPKGVRNVRLDAAYGWLEGIKNVQTTTTQALSNSQTSLTLDSVDGIFVDDVLLVIDDSREASGYVIVTAVNSGTNTVTFDSTNGLTSDVESGSDVHVFGRIPLLIERACLLLVNDFKTKIGSSSALRKRFQASMISERTDNYSYRLASPLGGDLGSRGQSSGNLEVDNLLSHFTAPPMITFA